MIREDRSLFFNEQQTRQKVEVSCSLVHSTHGRDCCTSTLSSWTHWHLNNVIDWFIDLNAHDILSFSLEERFVRNKVLRFYPYTVNRTYCARRRKMGDVTYYFFNSNFFEKWKVDTGCLIDICFLAIHLWEINWQLNIHVNKGVFWLFSLVFKLPDGSSRLINVAFLFYTLFCVCRVELKRWFLRGIQHGKFVMYKCSQVEWARLGEKFDKITSCRGIQFRAENFHSSLFTIFRLGNSSDKIFLKVIKSYSL